MRWYHYTMSEQTVLRVSNGSAEVSDTAACDREAGMGSRTVDSLRAEVAHVEADEDFTERARRLLHRDRELIERLAR